MSAHQMIDSRLQKESSLEAQHQTHGRTEVDRVKNGVLWTLQTLLAMVFLFAGGVKLVMPVADMTKQLALPGWFFRFIGVAEVLGAVGLILPWLLNIRRGLTPLAACGLVIIMIGATTLTVQHLGVSSAIAPFIVGLVSLFVAYQRWQQLKPQR